MEEENTSRKSYPKTLLLSGEEYFQQIEEDEVNFALIANSR